MQKGPGGKHLAACLFGGAGGVGWVLDDMKDLAHGLFKVAIILVRHKMGDHFCVSFGFELMALLQKIQFEGHVIFDDAIMDNRKFTAVIRMGMGIDVGRFSVSGPARMANADHSFRFMADEFLTQGIKTAHTFFHIDLTVMINGDTAGIIPAIFQFTQSINQKRGSLMAPNISNNSAHSLCLLMK